MEQPLNVQKIAAVIPVSACLLPGGCDTAGCNYCDPAPISRWTRTRWAVRGKVSTVRLRLGEWIAGRKFDDEW